MDDLCKVPDLDLLALKRLPPLPWHWAPLWQTVLARPPLCLLAAHVERRQRGHHLLTELGVSLTPRQKTSDQAGYVVALSGLRQYPQDLKSTESTQEPHLTPTDMLGRGPTLRRVQPGKRWSPVLSSPYLSGVAHGQGVAGDPVATVPCPRVI